MNVVLGKVVNDMMSSFQQAQQIGVYTSAQNYLMNAGLKTCAFVDKRTGIKCTDWKLVHDLRTGKKSDFCRLHKYTQEKNRELEQLRKSVGSSRKRRYIEIEDDDESGDDRFPFCENGNQLGDADDTWTQQPWSKQRPSSSATNKRPRTTSRSIAAAKPTVTTPNTSTPSTTDRPRVQPLQPQPQGPSPSSPTTELVNGLSRVDINADMDTSGGPKTNTSV